MSREVKSLAVVISDIDTEYQNTILKGVQKYCREYDITASVFSAFTGFFSEKKHDIGEYNIYNLMNIERFDGIIVVTNSILNTAMRDSIFSRIRAQAIPTVSINCDISDFYAISIDNEKAMTNIVEHFVIKHKCKRINYLSGPKDNLESQARLKAYRNVLEANGIEIDERRIYHGTFWNEDGPLAVRQFILSGLPMPEVIICANDETALTTILELQKLGYDVPKDIFVSGFDNIYQARVNSPRITSVQAPLLLSGYHACRKISLHYEGTPQQRSELLSTIPVFTESCGCIDDFEEDIAEFKTKNYLRTKMFVNGINLINRMFNDVTESDTFESTIDILKKYISVISCDKCFLCLNAPDEHHNKPKEGSSRIGEEYLVDGYTETMTVPIAYIKGEFVDVPNFRTSEILPIPASGEGEMYFFSPIHYLDRSMGYVIICNSDYPVESQLYYTWLMAISLAFENIRKLTALSAAVDELDKLYINDQLCGIYNRHGFNKFTKRLYRECVKNRWLTMVMFIDLDGLKYINDTFGHNNGDIAIAKMASEIERVCRNGEICARLGGDEFIIFAADYDEHRAEFIINEIYRRLAEYNKNSGLPFLVDGSIGYCLEFPYETLSLDKLIKIADDNMYENKKKRKAAKGKNSDER